MSPGVVGPPPHGGALISRVLRGDMRAAMQARARSLPTVQLSPLAASDVELIATGAFSPLTGFQGRADYERVLAEARLASGLVWPIPVTLPVEAEAARAWREGAEVALCEGERLVAVMQVAEIFLNTSSFREARSGACSSAASRCRRSSPAPKFHAC